jgi:hypothetical protein
LKLFQIKRASLPYTGQSSPVRFGSKVRIKDALGPQHGQFYRLITARGSGVQ